MKGKSLYAACLFVGLLFMQNLFAQNITTITGKVISAKDQSDLVGVSVRLKGTTKGVNTDKNGNFEMKVSRQNGTLVFTHIGFNAKEVSINRQSMINVSLTPAETKLQDVVVIGYGTVKKSDLTGSVSQVKSEQINAFPTTSVMQSLSGRAAGVQVLQNTGAPGDGISIRIRGTNSLQGNNEPLYVIDGFPTDDPSLVNNADIASIEILKDASATAIYGSRGANGVVLITTKKGKAGRTQVNVESSYSSQTLRKKLKLMNAKQYASLYNEQQVNDNGTSFFSQSYIDSLGTGFDWQDLVFQTAPMKTLSVNINGGTDKTQFSITGSTVDQKGIIKGSEYSRYSLDLNLNHAISKKINVSLASIMTRTMNDQLNDGAGSNRGQSMISGAISAPPTLTPYNRDGSYRVLSTSYPFISSGIVNPLNYINEQTDQVRQNKILTNASVIYNPIPELAIKVSGGIVYSVGRNDEYTSTKFVNSTGNASVSTSESTSLLSENTISYNKTFNKKHTVSAVAGFTYQDFNNTSLSGSGVGFFSDITQTYSLGSSATPGIPGSGYSASAIISYLGRVNYTYDNKYLATVSYRADGASVYSNGNKWGYFPSAALAWRVSNENFFRNINFISDLKLRAGWGNTGSQAIGAYTTLNQLSSGHTVFNNGLYVSYAPGTRLPGDLKWETTEQKDLGLDLGFLNNRILITADYYIKNTRDLLNNVQLPPSFGWTSTIQNIGEVQNKGFEFAVDARAFTGKFKWDINGNISFNKNKVVKLAGDEDILGGILSQAIIVDNSNILREGQPIGRFWGYLEDGYDEKGHIKFKDLDGDGQITPADETYIGDPNPDFTYGFNSVMNYKNFELSFFIQGTYGNDIFNVNTINNTIDYGYGLNMPEQVFTNHWTPANTNAKYPVISRSVTAKVSNRYIEDGSYMRLKNIQLAYNLSGEVLKVNWIRNLQLYVSGQNLLTLTKYSWYDPEVNARGSGNSTSIGYDWYSYPTSKSVTFGIRAGF
ncbi:TonB-dependent receptor [Ginsengibacter hankyongi]|uniref:TonB-dependent receptor n=1 Tax=Ginsengibacter hankyongi TaxID=2607284 RepID=A0A5J5IG85_9BACT|nr:TonB-dependent receptor [Ginsengibacter hankyongi]KAA9038674.1 TonB-dependent receptor [Ginsengibacter hankyongi]